MSYGMTSKLLQDVLPIEEPINTFAIRQHIADVAERLEQEIPSGAGIRISTLKGRPRKRRDPPESPALQQRYVKSHRNLLRPDTLRRHPALHRDH
jgi:hypothetical protein